MRPSIRSSGAVLFSVAVLLPQPVAAEGPPVRPAIARGIAALEKQQQADGTWPHPQIGMTALAGLTLLECGVACNDPAVRRAAVALRHKCPQLEHTYSLALALLFLDRLGDPADVPRIQWLAGRLLAGQNNTGGWNYICPLIGQVEIERLPAAGRPPAKNAHPENRAKGGRLAVIAQPALPRALQQALEAENRRQAGPEQEPELGDNSNTQFATIALWTARRYGLPVEQALAAVARRYRMSRFAKGGWGYVPLSSEQMALTSDPILVPIGINALIGMQQYVGPPPRPEGGKVTSYGSTILVRRVRTNGQAPVLMPGEHSYNIETLKPPRLQNRRHWEWWVMRDIPIEPLVRVSVPTVELQVNWATYEQAPAPPMIVYSQGKDGGFEVQVRPSRGTPAMTCAALLGLGVERGVRSTRAKGEFLKQPTVRSGLQDLSRRIGRPADEKKLEIGREEATYYFLWSLACVGRAYGLETIGSKDWYAWGAQLLCANQNPDGSWQGLYRAGGADTCFALLFLCGANLTPDLADHLKRQANKDVAAKQPGRGAAEPGSPLSQPAPGGDAEAAGLCVSLILGSAAQQWLLLEKLKEGKGVVYTEALAAAIPYLSGRARHTARNALAERLARMTAATLRDKMQSGDAEIRRAAALACALKQDKALIPDLMALLADTQPVVHRAAHVALKELTGTDFGPTAGADAKQRELALAAWKQWWNAQRGK
jgi:hypothetical protein